jgi:hypothetical protein
MVEVPTNAVPQILIKIQESIAALRAELTPRLDRIESVVRKQRRDSAATMVIMRATVGHFNERVGAVEERVTALETPKS